MKVLLRRPTFWVCGTVVAVVVLAAVFAGRLAPHPLSWVDLDHVLAKPGRTYLLGTDSAGRDELTRLLYGARLSLFAALIATATAVAIGVVCGLVAGYLGGRVDTAVTWTFTFVMSLPAIIVVLAFVAVTGPTLVGTMLLLGVLVSPFMYRLVRSAVKQVRNELYIDAARVAGLSPARIVRHHILAVVRSAIIVQTPIFFGASLLIQAAIDVLGLSDPDAASWGSMLNDAANNIFEAPWLSVWPGAAIAVTVLSVSLLGNVLRDALEAPTALHESPVSASEDIAEPPVVADPPDPARCLLSITDLSISHLTAGGAIPVVRDVTLAVERGQILGLVGESGSGKTQTVLGALGLLAASGRVDGGSVIFDGTDLTALRRREVNQIRGRRIGYVSQDPMSNLDPTARIGSQLTEPMRVHLRLGRRAARTRALDLLRRVGITEPERVLRAYPHEISGGMAQRVLIAGAISCDPELLIADEPTTALDVTVQAEVLDLLRSLNTAHGMAILLVTHDLGVVADLCDRVAVMRHGRVVEQARADRLFYSPATAYAKTLLASSSRFDDDAPADLADPASPLLEILDLRVDNAARSFGRAPVTVLHDVNLQIGEGETLGLVGESGTGKTTVGRAVLGLAPVHPRSEIVFAGAPISGLASHKRRHLGRQIQVVFQDPFSSLNPAMSIEEVLTEPLRTPGSAQRLSSADAARRVRTLLDRVRLPSDTGRRRARELSGGQRQRVAIARAIALRPRLIICDEPISALDVTTQAQILDLLTEIQRDTGVSYLFISHDLRAVRRISHRVAVMSRGQIVEIGDAERVTTNPSNPYTRRLLLSTLLPDPRLQARRRAVRGELERPEVPVD